MIDIIYYSAAFFGFIPVLIAVFYYRKLNPEMKLLFLLLLIGAMVEGLALYLADNGMKYYWVQHIYIPVEYGLLALIFSYWQNKQWTQYALRLSIPLFILVCAWDIFVFDNLNEPNVFTASIAFTLYVGISAYTLLYLQIDNPRPISRDYRFWVSTALFIYSAGGLAYFSFHEAVVEGWMVEVWAVHAILNIVAYTLYSVGIIWQTR